MTWFVVATFVTRAVATRLAIPPGEPPYTAVPTWLLRWRAVEAGLLTLIASLWFDSLGSGGWWLLFLLIGLLATLHLWFPPTERPKRPLIAESLGNLVRYVVAGALLAWRLS